MAPATNFPAWTCANCDVEIHHSPTFHVGLAFCCSGCVAGGPCTCTYDDEPARDDGAAAMPRERAYAAVA